MDTPLGTATIEPSTPVEAGKVGTWKLTLTVGHAGIASGGGFHIMPPVTEPSRHYMLVRWQLNTVSVAGPERSELSAHIVLLNHGRYDGAYAGVGAVRNLGRCLGVGEKVCVTLEHAVAPRFAMREARFEVEVDPVGQGRYTCTEQALPRPDIDEIVERFRLPDAPAVDVVPGPAVSLRAAARPCPEADGTLCVNVSVRDAFMNRATGFCGRVVLACMGGDAEPLATHEFVPADRGAHTFDGLPACGSGAVRVLAKVVDRPIECVSSPVALDFPMPVFFGDVHCHNWLDRSPGGAAELYEHARDVAGLEFVAMTDSSRDRTLCRGATRHYDKPGRFVTLFAEEWADGETADHRNVYYRGDPGDTVARAPHSMALFDQFRGKDVLVVPHTPNIDCLVGWKHTDWSRHDPGLQRLVEICQIRGDCEEEGPIGSGPKGGHGSSARSALARGLRLGFVGGSDTHRQTAGGPGHELHPLVKATGPAFWGQTGVLAPELTREAVFDALRERRCYATSGARILLWFEVNGHPMGSEICGPGAAVLKVRCHAEAPIAELAVVKNGRVWARRSPNELDMAVEFPDDCLLPGANYYYVRVTQADGHRAWSSPVWVDR